MNASRNSPNPQQVFLILLPVILWLLLGLVFPLGAILVTSFLSRTTYGEIALTFTLSNYVRIFDPILIGPIIRSLSFAIANTVFCLAVSIPLCFSIVKQSPPVRQILLFLVILPFWSSFLVRVFAWIVLLRGDGVLNNTLEILGFAPESTQMLYTWKSVFIGLCYVYIPFMILPVYASIEKLDGRLLRAAADLGASKWQAFWNISWPLIRPGVRVGVLFVSVMTFGDFVIADLLGGARYSLLGNVVKDQFLSARNWPFGSALVITLVLGMLCALKVILDVFLPLPSERGRR